MQSVTFRNKTWDVAADLHLPEGLDKTKTYPAIVVAHPISSCKEQTAGIHAAKLAKLGYVALAFDASTQGASGGPGGISKTRPCGSRISAAPPITL